MISTFQKIIDLAVKEEELQNTPIVIKKAFKSEKKSKKKRPLYKPATNVNNADKTLENLENKSTYISIFTQTNYNFIPFLIEIKLEDLDKVKLVKIFKQFIKRQLNYLVLQDKYYRPFEKRVPILKTNHKFKIDEMKVIMKDE